MFDIFKHVKEIRLFIELHQSEFYSSDNLEIFIYEKEIYTKKSGLVGDKVKEINEKILDIYKEAESELEQSLKNQR